MKMRKGELLLAPDAEAGGGSTPVIERLTDDPLMGALFEDLKDVISQEKAATEVPEIKPAPEAKPPETPPAQPPPATPPPKAEAPATRVGVKTKVDPTKVAEEVFERRMQALREAPAPDLPKPTPAPAVTPPAGDAELTPEQQEELADAEFAEKTEGEKFKGFSGKMRAFYKKVDDWVKTQREKDPDAVFDAENAEFRAFVERNKPSWGNARERIRIERIADARASRRIEEMQQTHQRELNETKRLAMEARYTPQIERQVAAIVEEFQAQTKSDDPLEAEVYANFSSAIGQLATDYLRLEAGIDTRSDSNPEELKRRHEYLDNFIAQQGQWFSKYGGEHRVRDGKTFMAKSDFDKLAVDDPKRKSSWTFSGGEVVRLLKSHGVMVAKKQIQAEEEAAVKRGFVRGTKQSPGTKPAEEPKPMSGPKAAATAAPGAAAPPEKPEDVHPGQELIETLGLKN